MTTLLDLMGDPGIAASMARADRVHEGWSGEAFALLREYMTDNEFFKAEDVRIFAHGSRGLPVPPDLRAWGGVVQRAVRERLIKKVGHGSSKNKTSHYRPVMVWQVIK